MSMSPYAAAEQNLGFSYQPRFALLRLLSLPETASVLIEKSDDLEFDDTTGAKSLASLKHKAVGNRLTDLDADFWKSVRIWLAHYLDDGRMATTASYLLFTTAEVAGGSFLTAFTDLECDADGREQRATQAAEALERTRSQLLTAIRDTLAGLSDEEAQDFYGRITILDRRPRITEIPQLVIDNYLRTIRREFRSAVFERLDGWWADLMIKVLAGERAEPVFGYEVSDKLSAIAEEYRSDSLPITFGGRLPDEGIDVANDPRIFVEQLRDLQLSDLRIQKAIIDYYRAFEQRSSWARESLLIAGEIEEYETRLVDEWERYRELIFERVPTSDGEDAFRSAGRDLYKWAELETLHLRIRERVTEPYVVRGAFHILANARPTPRVHWNPRFMGRLAKLLGLAA